jgi:hypothetical protein
MKKYNWFIILIWSWACTALADPSVGFGFKGGLSLSSENISGLSSQGITQDTLLGPVGGVFSDFKTLDFLFIQGNL